MLLFGAFAAGVRGATPGLILSCAPDNDLFQALRRRPDQPPRRCATPSAAVKAAPDGAGVLILADGYPRETTSLSAELLAQAARKKLRLYVEFPGALADLEPGEPRVVQWERAVVVSDWFGSGLPKLSILSPHQCVFVPVEAARPHLVLARVAGYDRAVYGLPDETHPLLFELPARPGRCAILVATTRLSQPVTARFEPVASWQTVWNRILGWLAPGARIQLEWTPTVRPAFARDEPLPLDVQQRALRRGVDWFLKSRLLLAPARTHEVAQNAARGKAPPPPPDSPIGDGSLGLLEGYFSQIQPDGSQPQSLALRGDCHGESAMALAFGATVLNEGAYARIARNLLDFYWFNSPARRGARGDPDHGAFGLTAWGISTPAWYRANYGDDNARLLLGTMATGVLLKEERWDEAMLQCLLANLRTTGRLGFRGGRIDIPDLTRHGWQHFFERRFTHFAPHYESYLWACFLWAYQRTGFNLFLDRAKTAIRLTMNAYPDRWRWTNGMQQERARMLLCLAWLVRLEDTSEHRGWLRRIATDLLKAQDACGAIREEIGDLARGRMRPPASNATYGTGETSLLQKNGDPVCDLLYTCNFALLGLHEAAAATGDPFYARAEARLARFLCRIQIRSEAHPELDGAWFRAFDFGRWDYWASNADAGWGAWSIESGWTVGWISSVLALRQMNTSLWELAGRSHIERYLDKWRPRMIPDAVLEAKAGQKVKHAAIGKPATLVAPASALYPGNGAASLTDGQLATLDHTDPAWLGFWANDLVATIDLGQPTPIHSLEADFLQNTTLGIFLPREVVFAVAEDSSPERALPAIRPKASERQPGAFRETFQLKDLNVSARFLHIRATNIGKVPAWHAARGKKAWLFVDEVLVNSAGTALVTIR